MEKITLRIDAKGRINLGELANVVSRYKVSKGDNGALILYPYVKTPFTDKWII